MRVADRGWKRRFEEPIPLPRGRQLVTLEEAGNYITKLPKAEHRPRNAANSFDMRDLGADDPARPRRGTPRIRIKRGMYE